MSLLRFPAGSRPGSAAMPALALAAAVLLAGCAQNDHRTSAADPAVAAPPYRVAGDPGARPDLEDDGREAQVPPLKRDRPLPDDPSQPWSPNYGKDAPVAPSRQADASDAMLREPVASMVDTATGRAAAAAAAERDLGRIVRGAVPDDLPPAFRRRLVSAMDE